MKHILKFVLVLAASASPNALALALNCLSSSGGEGIMMSGQLRRDGKLIVTIREGNYGGNDYPLLFQNPVEMHVQKKDGVCSYLYSDNTANPNTTIELRPDKELVIKNDRATMGAALIRLNGQDIHGTDYICQIPLTAKIAFDQLCAQ